MGRISFEVTVTCQIHGDVLKTSFWVNGGELTVAVMPCKKCMENAREEGRGE